MTVVDGKANGSGRVPRDMSAETTLVQAVWNGVVVAESSDTVVVEGNHYFPRDSLLTEFFEESDHRSACPWKGQARYLTLRVEGKQNRDAAWFYPAPKPAAAQIAGRVAFWKGVKVSSVRTSGDRAASGPLARWRSRLTG